MESAQLPPTEIPDLPPEPPQWPKVVGIISVCWGVLGLLCTSCMPFMSTFVKSVMPDDGSGLPPLMPEGIAMGVLLGGGLISAVLLITAGVLSISRKPLTKTLHVVYAIFAILMTAAGTKVNLDLVARQKVWAQEHPDSPFSKQMNNPGQKAGGFIGLAFSVGLGCSYPIFCLVWYGAVKRKAPLV